MLIAIFAALVFAYSLIARPVERFATAPIVFTCVGFALAMLVPEFRADDYNLEQFLWVAEAGLVLLLFSGAARTNLDLLRQIQRFPARLLGPGLLLTIFLGAGVALVFLPQLSFWEACILGAILAPTDAGLGQVIVQSPLVPEEVREALDVEAGLNDGLSVPFLLFFMAMLQISGESGLARLDIFIVHQLGFGALIGGAVGFGGGWLLQQASRLGGITDVFVPRAVVALPVLCFVIADAVDGSMFIAAFVAGLAVRAGFPAAGGHAVDFAEQWGELFNLAVFFLFGILLHKAVGRVEPEFVVYALLSLTLVRMLPVAIALWGSGVDRNTVLFIGWFGPRGLASIVLGLVFLDREINTPGEAIINGAVVVTVLLSVLLHGFSARPGIAWYAGQKARGMGD